ncbi:MAG TPA: shikimate kinase [Bacteroidales bacterium]|nr:shikimate kinase [Bacteroidales bacterium]
MIIYLIGFMGSGKSSTGRRLARKLHYAFVDLDDEIEKNAGQSISEIFRKYGEEHFRRLEAQVLRNIPKNENLVIATGGGTPIYHENMQYINATGVSVYLSLSVKTLASRLESSYKKRPLIENFSNTQLDAFIEKKLEEREPIYLQAQCIVKGETVKANHIIALVFGT